MTKPTIQVDLLGAGLSPETTRAGDLAAFVATLERAILETATRKGLELPDEALVSLVGVSEGSNRLTLAIASLVLPAAGMVSSAVHSGDYSSIPRAAHEALYEVSRQATDRMWTIRFHENPPANIKPAEISPDHPVPMPSAFPQATGRTILYGRCVRVGGVRPRAEISLRRGGTLYIDVSEDIARKLAHHLYDEVCIAGDAVWDTRGWTVQDFRAIEILDFAPGRLVEAFEQMAEAAHGRWDNVDVDAFVGQSRHLGGEE